MAKNYLYLTIIGLVSAIIGLSIMWFYCVIYREFLVFFASMLIATSSYIIILIERIIKKREEEKRERERKKKKFKKVYEEIKDIIIQIHNEGIRTGGLAEIDPYLVQRVGDLIKKSKYLEFLNCKIESKYQEQLLIYSQDYEINATRTEISYNKKRITLEEEKVKELLRKLKDTFKKGLELYLQPE